MRRQIARRIKSTKLSSQGWRYNKQIAVDVRGRAVRPDKGASRSEGQGHRERAISEGQRKENTQRCLVSRCQPRCGGRQHNRASERAEVKGKERRGGGRRRRRRGGRETDNLETTAAASDIRQGRGAARRGAPPTLCPRASAQEKSSPEWRERVSSAADRTELSPRCQLSAETTLPCPDA